jgi:hypothetical protein
MVLGLCSRSKRFTNVQRTHIPGYIGWVFRRVSGIGEYDEGDQTGSVLVTGEGVIAGSEVGQDHLYDVVLGEIQRQLDKMSE